MNVLPRSPVFVIAFYVIFLFRHSPVQYFDFFRARKGKRGVWGRVQGGTSGEVGSGGWQAQLSPNLETC
jgi:hypothetical protein